MHTHAHTRMCMHTPMCTCTHSHTRMCTHTSTCTCTHVCTHTHTCTHTCTRTTCIHTHPRAHAHTHKDKGRKVWSQCGTLLSSNRGDAHLAAGPWQTCHNLTGTPAAPNGSEEVWEHGDVGKAGAGRRGVDAGAGPAGSRAVSASATPAAGAEGGAESGWQVRRLFLPLPPPQSQELRRPAAVGPVPTRGWCQNHAFSTQSLPRSHHCPPTGTTSKQSPCPQLLTVSITFCHDWKLMFPYDSILFRFSPLAWCQLC